MTKRNAWLTSDEIGEAQCFAVFIPQDASLQAAFRGAFLLLCDSANWEQHGTQTPEAIAEAFADCLDLTLENWGSPCPE